MAEIVKDHNTLVLEALAEPMATPELDNFSLNNFIIENGSYKAKYATFRKITFDGGTIFNNVYVYIGLKFEDCKFNDTLVLQNVKSSGHDPIIEPNSNSIVFKNCTFNEKFQILGDLSNFERNLIFEDCFFEKGIDIEFLKIDLEGIIFERCTFRIDFHLNNLYFSDTASLTITNCQVFCFTTFFNTNGGGISITGENTFYDNVNIKEGRLGGITFNYGIFKKDFWITLVKTTNTGLNVIGSVFEKSLQINFQQINKQPLDGINSFFISASTFQDGFFINGSIDLFASKPKITVITIPVTSELKGEIAFSNLDIGLLTMSGFNKATNFRFNDLDINQIKMKGLINDAGLIFSNVMASQSEFYDQENTKQISNAIYIDQTNFGKAQFLQTDFSSFKKVSFRNNILTDISMSHMKWFNPNQLEDNEIENAKKSIKIWEEKNDNMRLLAEKMSLVANYKSIKEIYRQLKIASTKQGDITQSLEFQTWEMKYHWLAIKNEINPNYNDRFILWVSQTNDFGRNWLKAMIWLLGTSFIFYIPISLISSEKLIYSECATSWNDFLSSIMVLANNLHKWLIILNPTHRMNDLCGNNIIPKPIYYLDFLSRIAVSFFIFQMVSAFRKFHRK